MKDSLGTIDAIDEADVLAECVLERIERDGEEGGEIGLGIGIRVGERDRALVVTGIVNVLSGEVAVGVA